MTALEREDHELKRANEISRKASAFFVAAELDRFTKPPTPSRTRSSMRVGRPPVSSRSAGSWSSNRRRTDRICCVGKVAASVVTLLDTGLTLHALPHPNAQRLLTSAPNRGQGARMADLEAAWVQNLAALLRG